MITMSMTVKSMGQKPYSSHTSLMSVMQLEKRISLKNHIRKPNDATNQYDKTSDKI